MNTVLDKIEHTWAFADDILIASNMVKCMDGSVIVGSVYYRHDDKTSFYEMEVLHGEKFSFLWKYMNLKNAIDASSLVMKGMKMIADDKVRIKNGSYDYNFNSSILANFQFLRIACYDSSIYAIYFGVPFVDWKCDKYLTLAEGTSSSRGEAILSCIDFMKDFIGKHDTIHIDYRENWKEALL